MPRDALICRKKSGISRIRITMTSPTMDSAQAAPPAGSSPMEREQRVELDHDPGHDDHDRFEQTVEPVHRQNSSAWSVCGRGHVVMAVDGSCWWNVVHATRVPRVAAQHPPAGEPRAAERAVALHRDDGVLRAGRVEPAGRRRHRGDEQLVPRSSEQQEPTPEHADAADTDRRVMG